MVPPFSLSPILLLLALPSGAAAAPCAPQEAPDEELAAWRALVQRDQRVGFTPRTEEHAGLALDSGELSEAGRAVALYALGAGGAVYQRPRLEAAVLAGTLQEQRAAILALGEIGMGVERLLGEEIADPELGEYALLALLRTGRSAGRRRAAEIAASGEGPLAASVAGLEAFVEEPGRSRPTDAAQMLLDLRWKAAKTYGLVDGEAWSVVLQERLLAQDALLDEVVLRSASELRRFGVHDHLQQHLLEEGGYEGVRAAVRALPEELDLLLEYEIWRPEPEVFALIADAIEELGVPPESLGLLERVAALPELRLRGLALLARAGRAGDLEALADEWPVLSSLERSIACEAFGGSGDERALVWLRGREEGANERVRAAIVIARARLGDERSRERLAQALEDPWSEEHAASFELATRLAFDRTVASALDRALPFLDELEVAQAAAALCLTGRIGPLPILREVVRQGLPEGEAGLAVLRALVLRGTADDRHRLARLFPFERDGELPLDVNALLLRSMIGGSDLRALPALRAALWSAPIDRSILAGALVIEMGGTYLLREEILRRPVRVTESDFRRVGFALGRFGGIGEVRILASHARIHPGDPVLAGALLGALAARTQ